MGFYVHGAMVEYSSNFLGPIPNIVVFQFNPEQIARTLNIASRRDSTVAQTGQVNTRQTSSSPTESFTITAHFSAADDLGAESAASAIPRLFGIGPQLAALEKMVYTEAGITSGDTGAAVDATADSLRTRSDGNSPQRPVPREELPHILFIWGPARVLPVDIKSMTITEQKFDSLLNPVQAEVQIGLQVTSFPRNSTDSVGKGALTYTQAVKEVQAALNLAKAVEMSIDVIPF